MVYYKIVCIGLEYMKPLGDVALKKFFWFCYFAPDYELKTKAYPFHKIRDAAPFAEISAALTSLKYSFAESLLNYPASRKGVPVLTDGVPSPIQPTTEDLVVLTTRFPQRDADSLRSSTNSPPGTEAEKKGVESGSSVEAIPFWRMKSLKLWNRISIIAQETEWPPRQRSSRDSQRCRGSAVSPRKLAMED
jgi:hypothetical protein